MPQHSIPILLNAKSMKRESGNLTMLVRRKKIKSNIITLLPKKKKPRENLEREGRGEGRLDRWLEG